MLSHRKGAAFFPHISQGMLGAYQQLSIDITACANMWGEYWDELLCMVRIWVWAHRSLSPLGQLWASASPGAAAAWCCPLTSATASAVKAEMLQMGESPLCNSAFWISMCTGQARKDSTE